MSKKSISLRNPEKPLPDILVELFELLKEKYPEYEIDRVALSTNSGWLYGVSTCTGKVSDMCFEDGSPHFHAYNLRYEFYGERDHNGKFVSPYAFWTDLHSCLPVWEENDWYTLTGYRPPMTREEAGLLLT